MLLVLATRAKHDPNLLSLSRIRYFGVWPKGVASRRCWATQASDGDRVTPTWIRLACLEIDEEEGKERPKEKVSHLQEVTGPDIRRVIAEKRAPLLTSWLVGANRPHVLLDGALTHVYPQFQQFPANALSSPELIFLRHLPNQRDGLWGDLRRMRSSF